MSRVLIIILLSVLFVKPAYCQTSTDAESGTIAVATIMSISLTTNSGSVSFTGINDYANGQTMSNFATVTLKSNALWLVSLSSNATYFTALSNGATTTMPASILSYKLSTGSTYTALSTTSQTLKTGGRGAGQTFNVDVNFNPGFNYPGGLYSIGLVYTLTSQ